ncbi:mitotic deacetylase-associated SANT domain protein [Erpetoichthys calabaricus]|uniref:Mitotic deacetylase associated SANT domain protein b n=1 Tax=Erpetoichthys calabaricus TaxID=27687 RepID=A0A8C4T1U1_ERPCA|nr:mitotic deacetylase-associated SANT domain protein [Erpetoichthys calabaricus]XP_028678154.1 mitotic deacetylase-associated SANT domain protein [Erpetoichthys calabaricus]XP_028678155.1 mitotic deacetylase-associated SANT domain protein [Erpetoichthys calabaricus]
MNLPPQPKEKVSRAGKRITFFNTTAGTEQLKDAPQLQEEMYYSQQSTVHSGPGVMNVSDASSRFFPSVIYSTGKGDRTKDPVQQMGALKWNQGGNDWTQGGSGALWGQKIPLYRNNPLESHAGNPGFGVQVFSNLCNEAVQQPKRGQEKAQLVQNPAKNYRGPNHSDMEWEQQQQQQQQQQQHQQQQQQLLNRSAAQFQPFHQSQKHGSVPSQPAVVLQPFQVAFGSQKQQLPHSFFSVLSTRSAPDMDYIGQPKSHQQVQHQMQQAQQNQILDTMFPKSQQHLASQTIGPQTLLSVPLGQFPPTSLNSDLHVYSSTLQTEPPSNYPLPRRSRRLSKESVPPVAASQGENHGNPFLPSWNQVGTSFHPHSVIPVPSTGNATTALSIHNGASEDRAVPKADDIPGAPVGVIQSTRRKRRSSQEVNLHTLAQKASEMESIPHPAMKEVDDKSRSSIALVATGGTGRLDGEGVAAKRPRDENLLPLVIPVSVPVKRVTDASLEKDDVEKDGSQRTGPSDRWPLEQKASVIVTRRRSLRNSLSESTNQDEEVSKDDEGKSGIKSKRRPRPEPLFIPPKTGPFITPPVYSNITPYQSHLRSPVRLADNPLVLPPYTPPPILSPVREGSGLYFSAFLSSSSSSLPVPPAATPKSATRSLLRSNSSEITPPILPIMGDATPVSIEPRINIGPRYQAEIPELRDRAQAQLDLPKAELVWTPLEQQKFNKYSDEPVQNLMDLACSSVLHGGGTNQELALHCLHEAKGNIMEALTLLLLKNPIFPKSHPLADYHYSGSDSWSPTEKQYFNKGISAYKKDFILVQKLVRTKTVAQCVEFYYTYKKQVKIGRNGTLVFGDCDTLEGKNVQDDAEINVKGSQRCDVPQREAHKNEEVNGNMWVEPPERRQDSTQGLATQTLRTSENTDGNQFPRSHTLPLETKPEAPGRTVQPHLPKTYREPPITEKKKTEMVSKVQVPETTFPCKKCGRVFYKVKSRSAHMKSHAEQEKKAAALKQKLAEEQAAARALAAQRNGAQRDTSSSDEDSEDGEDEDEDDEDWH